MFGQVAGCSMYAVRRLVAVLGTLYVLVALLAVILGVDIYLAPCYYVSVEVKTDYQESSETFG